MTGLVPVIPIAPGAAMPRCRDRRDKPGDVREPAHVLPSMPLEILHRALVLLAAARLLKVPRLRRLPSSIQLANRTGICRM